MRRSTPGLLALAAVVLIAATADAISARKCAKKCTITIEQCILGRGVAQCGNADPARACLDALDAQCESEAVAGCLETGGESCKKPPCEQRISDYCACQLLGEIEFAELNEFLPRLCNKVPKRCRRQLDCNSTTTTTLPPSGGDTALLCCILYPETSGPCSVVGSKECPLSGPDASPCQVGFTTECQVGRQVAVPAQLGQGCAESYGCN
jgi:hypothetical protein